MYWLFGILLAGLYGYLNHLLHYGSNEISLTVVILFWSVGGFLTVLTGSAIPFIIMHLMNNLFFDLKNFYSNDLILIFTIVVLILLSSFYLYLYVFKKKKKIETAIQEV